MILHCEIDGRKYHADLNSGTDISLSLGPEGDNPNAFGIPYPVIAPIRVGDFVGSVEAGSGANCDTIAFCAHGNGTHTECIGHITKNHESVNQLIRTCFCTAQLISLPLFQREDGDWVVTTNSLAGIHFEPAEAIVVRSLPNHSAKRHQVWSGNNPPYFEPEVLAYFRDKGIKHLLTDFPSVDREEDGGALLAHHAWWHVPESPRPEASITEMIYVPDHLEDGLYALNLQFAPMETDASPSRPMLFSLIPN